MLFVDQKKVNSELEKKLNLDGFWLKNYDEIIMELEKLANTNLLIEPSKMTALLINSLDKSVKIIQEINPSTHLKAAKNTKEIAHIQDAMIEDGVALCKFLPGLKKR